MRRWCSSLVVSAKPAHEVVVAKEKPVYLDFNNNQRDIAVSLGLLKVGSGGSSAVGTGSKEAPCPPKTLVQALRRNVPEPYKAEYLGDDQPVDVSRYMEEMLEMYSETHEPSEVLLLVLRAFPHLRIAEDAAALLIHRYTELSEERFRTGEDYKFWGSKVYPMYTYLTIGRKAELGPQVLRAMEDYLEKAVDKGEVSLNYANYIIQNLKTTEQSVKDYMKTHRTIARGGFQQVMERHNLDDELDFKTLTMLMQHVPDFFDKFPYHQPQAMGDFLHEIRKADVTYVLHHSYLLETSTEHPTVLSRAKYIVELLSSDDDPEVLLVPYWTLEKLLHASLDHKEDLSKVISYLASHFSKNGKVRFLWPSECISPLLMHKELVTLLDNDDDKMVTFAKWLDKVIPPLSEHEIQEWEEEKESAEVEYMRGALYGFKKSKIDKIILGKAGKQYPRLIKTKSKTVTQEVQQGVIVLATDRELQNHCRALQLPVEPREGYSGRPADDLAKHLKMRVIKFIDARASLSQNRVRTSDKKMIRGHDASKKASKKKGGNKPASGKKQTKQKKIRGNKELVATWKPE